MPYAFVAESALLPPYPAYQCPAVILHGLEDEVVPVQTTQGLMTDGTQQADLTRAVFVHDKHGLDTPATLALLPPLISEFFQLEEGSGGSSAAIEVEKKYAVADAQEVEKKLLRQEDVQKVMEMMFIDSYWDSADNSLARQDSWLRLRAGLWELKTPIPASASGAGTAVYREATALEDVTATLRRVCPQAFLDLPPAATSTSQRLKGALQERGWAPFVTFGTKRRKYRCQGFTIDTDEASYGHAVLEVEAMCTTSSEVGAAESAIEQMAHALGLAAAGKARGKVEEYLLRYQPEKLGVIKAARQALREGK
ncbi:CYTH-like domain-containing protein [Tribonema minus]|uniref:CYTH-like domain-containing protein n=1 Tax=Tribonema minus TaxID=303371 RepID=A0A835YU15_9STRA|nr:CYTH-like domain-containing protein [Tribonema minus]